MSRKRRDALRFCRHDLVYGCLVGLGVRATRCPGVSAPERRPHAENAERRAIGELRPDPNLFIYFMTIERALVIFILVVLLLVVLHEAGML
jgi:hypothetical protein